MIEKNPFENYPVAPIPPELFDEDRLRETEAQVDALVPDQVFTRRISEDDFLRVQELLQEKEDLLDAAIDNGGLKTTVKLIRKINELSARSSFSPESQRKGKELASRLTTKNLRRFDALFDRHPDAEGLLDVLETIMETLPKVNTSKHLDFLVNHMNLASSRGDFEGHDKDKYGSPLLELGRQISIAGDKGQQETFIDNVLSLTNSPDPIEHAAGVGLVSYADSYHGLDSDLKGVLKQTATESIISKYGLNLDEARECWGVSSGNKSGNFGEGAHLRTLQKIERERPGCARMLQDQFGIINFGRYPSRALVSQFDHRNDSELRAGKVVVARKDHGVIEMGERIFGGLYDDLQKLDAGMRIYEEDSKAGIVKTIRDGDYRPAEFIILVGHGRSDRITFGDAAKGEEAVLTQDDVRDLRMPYTMRKHTIEGCDIILVSCVTGKDGGIGQEISRQYPDKTITAPSEAVSLRSLSATKDAKDHIRIKIEYGSVHVHRKFMGGKAVQQLVSG